MKQGTGAVAALVAILAVGCADGGPATPSADNMPPNDLAPCEEIYAEGVDVANDTFGLACVKGEQLISPRPVRLECTDGRELLYNDLAWGYIGETMTTTPDDDPSKMPEAEVDECLAPTADGTPADPTGEAVAETDPG